jgi:hypothetical protein
MAELKFETWLLTPESLFLTTAPWVLKSEHTSKTPDRCIKHDCWAGTLTISN